MLSYEEAVIEAAWNLITLWDVEASHAALDESVQRLRAIVEGGPEDYGKDRTEDDAVEEGNREA